MLSGCWTQIGYGPENQRFNPRETSLTDDNVASLEQAWAVDLQTYDEPIVSGGRAFVTHGDPTTSQNVRAVDVASGTTVWDREIATAPPGQIVDAGPVSIASGQISTSFVDNYQPGENGDVGECEPVQLQLDPASGSETHRTSGFRGHPPVESGDTVIQMRTTFPEPPSCFVGPTILHVTPGSGPAWSAELPGGYAERPIVTGDLIIVPNGSVLWGFPVNGCGAETCPPTWLEDITGGAPVRDIVAGGDKVFAIAHRYEGTMLMAIDRASGAVAWRAPIDAQDAQLALAGDRVYVATESGLFDRTPGTVLAFDTSGCGAAACEPVWSGALDAAVSTEEGPVVAGGVLYVGTDAAVEAYSTAGCGGTTCEPLATIGLGGVKGLSVSDGHLFATTGAQLLAFAPR